VASGPLRIGTATISRINHGLHGKNQNLWELLEASRSVVAGELLSRVAVPKAFAVSAKSVVIREIVAVPFRTAQTGAPIAECRDGR